ncbi:MAG TPA: hypothetical protein VF383_11740 [Candidatus Dormibacteraeota bacterium]
MTRLLSRYETHRDANGDLVVMMPWPGSSLLGCAAPAAVVAIGAALVARFAHADGMYGLSAMTLLFAVIVIPIVIYQSSHAWILSRGFIKPATTLARRHWPHSGWLGAGSVVLKRELWPGNGGSTDTVWVVTDGTPSPLKVASVYNWDGNESRLASGGMGSLARSGPRVPSAHAPLVVASDVSLKMSVSEAISEIADLVAQELGVPLGYAWGYTRQRPDDID